MSKVEQISQELTRLSERDLDRILVYVRVLADARPEEESEASVPMLAAEPLLARDWLSPEEDAAWANL